MPSAYTALVQDGTVTTLREFAMKCARNFGATIMMRDDPLSAEIPERFVPSDYYQQRINETNTAIEQLEAKSDEDIRSEIEIESAKKLEWRREAKEKDLLSMSRYSEMLSKVREWKPPTEDHIGMKEFMVRQLEEAITFDCNCHRGDWFYDVCYPTPEQDVAEYRQNKLAKLRQCLSDYHVEAQAEIDRTEKRNDWIAKLRESLS